MEIRAELLKETMPRIVYELMYLFWAGILELLLVKYIIDVDLKLKHCVMIFLLEIPLGNAAILPIHQQFSRYHQQ